MLLVESIQEATKLDVVRPGGAVAGPGLGCGGSGGLWSTPRGRIVVSGHKENLGTAGYWHQTCEAAWLWGLIGLVSSPGPLPSSDLRSYLASLSLEFFTCKMG